MWGWARRNNLGDEIRRECELRDAVNRGLSSDTVTQLRYSRNFPSRVLVRHAGDSGWIPYNSLGQACHAILNRDER